MTKEKTGIQRSPESEAFNLAQREAGAWASSSLVPDAYQDNVPNVLIAMEMAKRIGASVMAVMQNLHIIHGKPAFGASFLIATVNGSGRFTPIRYRMEGTQGEDDWGCRAYATDRESGEECTGPAITVKMAKAEGWWSKKDRGGNECSKWQTMPELMLHYRAAAFWTRVYCPELSMGIHTTEEMEDVEDVHTEPARVVRPIDQLTANLKAAQKEKADPNADELPDTDTDTDAEPERNLILELDIIAKQIWGETKFLDELDVACAAAGVNMEKMNDAEAVMMIGMLSGQLKGDPK